MAMDHCHSGVDDRLRRQRDILGRHQGLRYDKTEWAVLGADAVAGGRLAGIIRQIDLLGLQTAQHGTQRDGEPAIPPAGQIWHVPRGNNRTAHERHKCQAENNLPDRRALMPEGLSRGKHSRILI